MAEEKSGKEDVERFARWIHVIFEDLANYAPYVVYLVKYDAMQRANGYAYPILSELYSWYKNHAPLGGGISGSGSGMPPSGPGPSGPGTSEVKITLEYGGVPLQAGYVQINQDASKNYIVDSSGSVTLNFLQNSYFKAQGFALGYYSNLQTINIPSGELSMNVSITMYHE